MEVTPEIFAWLASLNIIDPFKSLSEDAMSNFIIPENTLNLLFGGKYMDIILNNLQDAYNQFYKVKMDYIYNLNQLKHIDENQEYISNSIKYANWQIIVEILSHFGLSYSEEDINLLVNNDKEQLNKIITKIYNLFTQFLKYSKNNNNIEDNNIINTNNNNNTNTNRVTKKHIISTVNKNYELTKESKIEITDNNINNNLDKNANNNIKAKEQSLNINDIDPYKPYKECNSILEFFILSICKNMQMKPRQSIALLSNNRKYLSKICHRGFNNQFTIIKRWLTDLYNNKDIMIKLIQNSDDGSNICYGVIGTALLCKDQTISLQAGQLLNIIKYKIGVNRDWLSNEGINTFIFILTKDEIHKNNEINKKEFLKILYELIKDDTNYFFDEIKKRIEVDKKKIYDFLSNILPYVNKADRNFGLDFQNLLYDICLKDQIDHSYSLSMLSDTFFYFYPIEEGIINKIINYFKECIKNNGQNIFSTAIFQVFILMERLEKTKNKYAPQLYKTLVFLFLEEYDNELKREIILEGFEKFFNNNQDIPIDILLEPYLNQLNSCQNYALCDFLFFFKILEHPRIENKDIMALIQFILNVCLNNVIYSRTANLILSLIFEKNIIESKCTNAYDINEIEYKFVDFINTALDSYITNISKEEDKFILETPYDIMTENFTNVNMQVKDSIVKSIKCYRKLKNKHSNGLLAMLWYYNDNDDIMCQIEEINRPIYEPLEEYYEKRKKEQEEKDKKNYTKKLINNLNQMQIDKKNTISNRQLINEKKKFKEEKIKKSLEERRRITNVMSGIETSPHDLILFSASKLKRTGSDFYNLNLKKNNSIQTGKLNSNMLFAMNNATQKYMKKGIILENSKKHSQISSYEFSSQNVKLKRNLSQINIIENKNNDDIIKKFGTIMSIDKKKLVNEAEKEYKQLQKLEISKLLIQKEGKYIKNTQILSSNKSVKYFLSKNIFIDRSMGLPFDLENEENRELKAITGYNKEYKKNIRFYFKCYSNEAKQTITKSKFIKMMRDKGIGSEKLDYDEITTIIRRLFNENLNEFNFNQFINLLVQLSYLIYTKRRPTLTIGETYGILLKRFSIANDNAKKVELLKIKYHQVIDYLLDLKAQKQYFNLPEGFKFVKKTSVKYNSRLAPHFLDILGEGKYICYQVLEDILFNIFNSSIIEPYVEVSTEESVEIEPEKLHLWSPDLTMAYIDLDKKYKFHGMFAADSLEDLLRKLTKKKNSKEKNFNEKNLNEKNFEEEKNQIKKANKFNMSWVRKDINKKIQQLKQKKIEEKKKKIQKRIGIFKVSKEEKEKIKSKFEEVKKRREKKEEERKNKILSDQEKKKEKDEKKIKAWIDFYKGQKLKLKEQFKKIVTKRKETIKIEEEKKEKEKKLKKEYQDKSLHYVYEGDLNRNMKELITRKEIKDVFEKYNSHLKLIYDIYSKISYNKISFYSKEVIKIDEFKQFLINFTVLGVVISTEQMIWIFNNISKVLQNERNNQMYFDFEDFKLSLCYLAILAKSTFNRNKKITQTDIDETNGENIENFIKSLGIKLPFNRLEIEKFINERRSMTMKNLITIQNKMKRENFWKKNNLNSFNKEEEMDKNLDNKEQNDDIDPNVHLEKNKNDNININSPEIKNKNFNNNNNNNQSNLEKTKDNNSTINKKNSEKEIIKENKNENQLKDNKTNNENQVKNNDKNEKKNDKEEDENGENEEEYEEIDEEDEK